MPKQLIQALKRAETLSEKTYRGHQKPGVYSFNKGPISKVIVAQHGTEVDALMRRHPFVDRLTFSRGGFIGILMHQKQGTGKITINKDRKAALEKRGYFLEQEPGGYTVYRRWPRTQERYHVAYFYTKTKGSLETLRQMQISLPTHVKPIAELLIAPK